MTRITKTKAISGIPVIELFAMLDGSTKNLNHCWEIWKYDFTLYKTASGITQDSQKLALWLYIGGTEVKEIYRTVKDSQGKYDDVVCKFDLNFTLNKTLSYECYSFKICKEKPGGECSAYITR